MGAGRFSRAGVLASALAASSALAQIGTDSTLGRAAQNLAGPNFLIPEALGKLSGSNLFHSFRVFSIGAGESATFTTASPGIANVISRVTGGSLSQINGLLRLSAASGAPAFYFINPAGVAFGAGASIDVPGAFHVSTADYLKFPDGKFYADGNSGSTFSSAPPEAFGFLGAKRAAISLNSRAALSTQATKPVSITAGDIEMDNALVVTAAAAIRIAAVGSNPVEVPLQGPLPSLAGELTIRRGGIVDAVNAGSLPGGEVAVSAGNITIDGQGVLTGIATETDDIAKAGNVTIMAGQTLALRAGGIILSNSYWEGDAGTVAVRAGNVTVEGAGSQIGSNAYDMGDAGAVDVHAAGDLRVLAGASIASNTFWDGDGGRVVVNASNITLDGQGALFAGIGSDSAFLTGGSPGSVEVNALLRLDLVQGGVIVSRTNGNGNAGSVSVRATDISIDGNGFFTGITSRGAISPYGSGAAGAVDVRATRALSVVDGGSISSDTFGDGNAGSVKVSADSIRVDGNGIFASISSSTSPYGSGAGGSVEVTATQMLEVVNRGRVAAVTEGPGNAGTVKVSAPRISVDGEGLFAEILSSALPFSSGDAGKVEVTASEALRVVDGGSITSDSQGSGAAGVVRVSAGHIILDDQGNPFVTQISSDTYGPGNGGTVEVHAAGDIELLGGAKISSNTHALGDAGAVIVTARNILIDGSTAAVLTGIFSLASESSAGADAGAVAVEASGTLTVLGGATISSDSRSSGNAGSVDVRAGDIRIDGYGRPFVTGISSDARGSGNAGDVAVAANGQIEILNGGTIASDTYSNGDAGSVAVSARRISIDADRPSIFTGISSETLTPGMTGNAGDITVSARESLRVLHGGAVSSSTFSDGAAGSVRVDAGTVLVDGTGGAGRPSRIVAAARTGSSGQTGSVAVVASDSITISNDGIISIGNDALVSAPEALVPTQILVSAPRIWMFGSGGRITAAATGNVAASNVSVDFGSLLSLNDSAITTSAQDGDGGTIQLAGTGMLRLKDSRINTSVLGPSGDGGDIDLRSGSLIMDDGFIQANTAAAQASGGDVSISTGVLVHSGILLIGGDTPLGFSSLLAGVNVIQAAAPDGVSGTLRIGAASPDVAGSLTGLESEPIDPAVLGKDLCRMGAGSSLTPVGRGGPRPTASGLIRPDGAAAFAVSSGDAVTQPARPAVSRVALRTTARRCDN